MKKVTLALLLSMAYSLNAVWYNPVNLVKKVNLKEKVPAILCNAKNTATENWWRTGCVVLVVTGAYVHRKGLKKRANKVLVRLGLKSENY